MELKSFVTQALVEIIEGVKDAQETVKETGAKINPQDTQFPHSRNENRPWLSTTDGGARYGQTVEFDVSVMASERDEAQGGVGIQVASITLGLGLSGKTEDQSSVISRLKFSVPVFLPESPFIG